MLVRAVVCGSELVPMTDCLECHIFGAYWWFGWQQEIFCSSKQTHQWRMIMFICQTSGIGEGTPLSRNFPPYHTSKSVSRCYAHLGKFAVHGAFRQVCLLWIVISRCYWIPSWVIAWFWSPARRLLLDPSFCPSLHIHHEPNDVSFQCSWIT